MDSTQQPPVSSTTEARGSLKIPQKRRAPTTTEGDTSTNTPPPKKRRVSMEQCLGDLDSGTGIEMLILGRSALEYQEAAEDAEGRMKELEREKYSIEQEHAKYKAEQEQYVDQLERQISAVEAQNEDLCDMVEECERDAACNFEHTKRLIAEVKDLEKENAKLRAEKKE